MRQEQVLGKTHSEITYFPPLDFLGIVLLQRDEGAHIQWLQKARSVSRKAKSDDFVVLGMLTESEAEMGVMLIDGQSLVSSGTMLYLSSSGVDTLDPVFVYTYISD